MDNGIELTNTELGMYDLTPYFNLNIEDPGLIESIMLCKNKTREIEHTGPGLFFSPPQFEALEYLANNRRVILSAPTSFGKTLLVKEYIYKYKPRKVIYIVPTNALAYELEKSFKENQKFSNYLIYDKCLADDSRHTHENLLFIGTQEKYLELNIDKFDNVDLFVIDEAYKLKETTKKQRYYKLSETFLNSIAIKARKVFLLTPNARLEGFDKYEFSIYQTYFNAVDKLYHTIDENSFFNTLIDVGRKNKTILFCKNPEQIDGAYGMIKPYTSNNNITDFVEHLESEVHPDWNVIKLLKAGILTHHGQMPKYIQNKMIRLFNDSKEYNLLFGTNSISEGINTLTKNVFIHPEVKPKDDVLLLKNTIGRAGRLGVYPIGHIYSIHDLNNLIQEETIVKLAISNDEEIEEIENGKNADKINKLCEIYDLEFEFCEKLLKKYKISLNKLQSVLESLKTNENRIDIGNLVYLSTLAFPKDYQPMNINHEQIIMRGYLQSFYYDNEHNTVPLSNFDDRITFFKVKSKINLSNSKIINMYMKFIYSSLEYCIMPLVNIGLDIHNNYPDWHFGNNIYDTLVKCKKMYQKKAYGKLDYDSLSDSHKLIINALKDYGITSELKSLNKSILSEIEHNLKTRYSTYDVLKVIDRLSDTSSLNRNFFFRIKMKYLG